jgi:hypothetical protein
MSDVEYDRCLTFLDRKAEDDPRFRRVSSAVRARVAALEAEVELLTHEPTLERDGFDARYVMSAAEAIVAGSDVGHAPTAVGELIAAYQRVAAENEKLRASGGAS